MSSRRSPARSDRSAPGGSRCDDRGQAAVEFALALPIVVVVALGLVQVVIVAVDYIAVDVAARNAARAASVSASPAAAAQAAADRSVRLDATTSVAVTGETVTVTVRAVNHTTVPLIGRFIGDVTVEATVTMPREPP